MLSEMKTHTILIVDDDKDWLRSASKFFIFFNYEVLTAPTCAEGLALARKRRPDCVLLDFHLPDSDAGVFCSSVRSDPALKKTPVIVASVDGGQECSCYLNHQADGFMLKGGPLNTIRLMVESLLRRVRWERGIIEKGDLCLETESLTVFRNSKPLIRLTLEQFRFFYLLLEKSPCFVPESDLLEFIFVTNVTPKFDSLRGLANRLRVKLGPRLGRRIKNKSASGWIYVQPPKDPRRPVSA